MPLDGRGNLLLRYRGGSDRFVTCRPPTSCKAATPAATFANAMVFVGATALGTREIVATPLARQFTGVEVQATVADNLLQQDYVSRPEDALVLETLLVLIVGIAVTLLVSRFGLALGTVSAFIGLIGLWAGSRLLLSMKGEYPSPFFPALGVLTSLAGATIAKLTYERGRADRASTEKDLAQRLMVQSLLSLTETRDAETGRHSRRTRQYHTPARGAAGVESNLPGVPHAVLHRAARESGAAPRHRQGWRSGSTPQQAGRADPGGIP